MKLVLKEPEIITQLNATLAVRYECTVLSYLRQAWKISSSCEREQVYESWLTSRLLLLPKLSLSRSTGASNRPGKLQIPNEGKNMMAELLPGICNTENGSEHCLISRNLIPWCTITHVVLSPLFTRDLIFVDVYVYLVQAKTILARSPAKLCIITKPEPATVNIYHWCLEHQYARH